MRKVSSYDVTKNGTLIITNNEAVAQVQLPAAHQPFAFHLAQNYPNPFNPSTVIAYTIPEGGDSRKNEVGRKITLIVYDILGREVVTLVNEVKQPGNYSVRFDAGTRASGLYLYRLTAGGFTQTKAMMLVK
jgi:hypothetical protein